MATISTRSASLDFLDPHLALAHAELLNARLPGDGWLPEMANHQLAGGGKLLRAALCLWTAEAAGGRAAEAAPAAAAVQLLHEFTLVHDDVQDGDRERRHRPTVWALWGCNQAINAGDGIFAWAIERLLQPGAQLERRALVAHVLVSAVRKVVEGQCRDLAFERHPDTSPTAYLEMVELKTGALLGAALEAGAIMAGASARCRSALRVAGVAAGAAFQVRDDWLGTWGDPGVTGKPADGDLRRRKLTYPVCAAFAAAGPPARRRLLALYGSSGAEDVQPVRRLLEELAAESATRRRAEDLARSAVEAVREADLPEPRVEEFEALVEHFVTRPK